MKITTKGDSFILLLEGMERFWAVKACLCIKVQDITDVIWNPGPTISTFGWLKMPGTSLPKLFHAGSFWRKSGWEFWYLKDREAGELIIQTRLRRYKTVRLTTSEATAFEVRQWFNRHITMRNIA